MIKRVGQLSGEFSNSVNLITEILTQQNIAPNSFNSIRFFKLGLQTEYKNIIKFNDQEFQIGRTGKLEFDNLNIANEEMYVFNSNTNIDKAFAIIDFVYTMEQKE